MNILFTAVIAANALQKLPSLWFKWQMHCKNSLPCSYSGKCIANSSGFVAFILFTSCFQVHYWRYQEVILTLMKRWNKWKERQLREKQFWMPLQQKKMPRLLQNSWNCPLQMPIKMIYPKCHWILEVLQLPNLLIFLIPILFQFKKMSYQIGVKLLVIPRLFKLSGMHKSDHAV